MSNVTVQNSKIKGLVSNQENSFKVSESEEYFSIAYETGAIYTDGSEESNSVITIDFKKDYIQSDGALVNEWFIAKPASFVRDESYYPNVSGE